MRYLVSFLCLVCIWLSTTRAHGSASTKPDSTGVRNERLIPLAITGGALYTGSLAGLYTLWYRDFDQQPFHFFNDNDQWLQMDKVGHAMTAYYMTKVSDDALTWSGVDRRKSLFISSAISFSYLGIIEVFDGFSAEWGFSMGDMVANCAGIGLYLGQEAAWGEQRLVMKYNFLPSAYAGYRPDALGATFYEQMLKDYNGQCYWLSTNPHQWINAKGWPKWLNLAIGYSAAGMTGGSENVFPLLEVGDAVPDFQRRRQVYLSLDVDLHQLPARRNWFKAVRTVFGFVKIPAPAIGIDTEGRFIGGIR
jgi:hypothetical protein